jgi:hypothetical protein
MSEKELGKVLVGQSSDDDRATIERVIRRERRLTQGLTGLTLAFWLLTAAMVVTQYVLVLTYVMPSIERAAMDQDPRSSQGMLKVILHYGLNVGKPMAIGSAVMLLLAAVCTVLLVYWSRRVTLRLVDRRLEQILAELRRLPPGV